MNSNKFRKQLKKIMPGYSWTVHRGGVYRGDNSYLVATGVQTSGFNRLSTVQVERYEENDTVLYCVKSAGYGRTAPWLGENKDITLARALRGLQDYYENMASNHRAHARRLEAGRGK